jgi:regulator of replication initiation timing
VSALCRFSYFWKYHQQVLLKVSSTSRIDLQHPGAVIYKYGIHVCTVFMPHQLQQHECLMCQRDRLTRQL